MAFSENGICSDRFKICKRANKSFVCLYNILTIARNGKYCHLFPALGKVNDISHFHTQVFEIECDYVMAFGWAVIFQK